MERHPGEGEGRAADRWVLQSPLPSASALSHHPPDSGSEQGLQVKVHPSTLLLGRNAAFFPPP